MKTKRISVIVEIDVPEEQGETENIILLNRLLNCKFLKDDEDMNINEPNIVAISDKVSFLKQINQADKFQSFLELNKSTLAVGIDIFNSPDSCSIPSSIDTDFSLNRVSTYDIKEIKDE